MVQRKETDFQFLFRIMRQYGLYILIRPDKSQTGQNKLVIMTRSQLETQPPFTTLYRGEGYVKKYQFDLPTITTIPSVQSTTVSYHDPTTKSTISGSASNSQASPVTGSSAYMHGNDITDTQDAQDQADSYQRWNNVLMARARIEMAGNPLIAAGYVLNLNGWGIYDKPTWLIRRATQRFDVQGYRSILELGMALGNYDSSSNEYSLFVNPFTIQ